MQTIRCSALPRILSCPASLRAPEIEINTAGEAATIGTAAHEFYAEMVRRNLDHPADSLFALAEKHDVDADELSMLAWAGLTAWRTIRDRIDVTAVESELSGTDAGSYTLTGHPDMVGRLRADPTTGVIVDWKTGHKEATYLPQLHG